MAFLIILLVAFVLALALQRKGKRLGYAVLAPVASFVVFVLFDAYVLPYRGGGVSMWPIAIMFGAPVAFAGGLLGFIIGRRFGKPSKGEENAF
jgi:asparagine N-glycosylation enzyme membrane subunit Stt3